jgi:hypothetical protein
MTIRIIQTGVDMCRRYRRPNDASGTAFEEQSPAPHQKIDAELIVRTKLARMTITDSEAGL